LRIRWSIYLYLYTSGGGLSVRVSVRVPVRVPVRVCGCVGVVWVVVRR
jgi:hypothetical protein